MKKIFYLMLLVVFSTLDSIAQNPIWSLPNKLLDVNGLHFLPIPTTYPNGFGSISWPSGYDGRAAEHAHNAMHDANGDLLFFIIDGYIFDKNGYLMSDEMQGLGDV